MDDKEPIRLKELQKAEEEIFEALGGDRTQWKSKVLSEDPKYPNILVYRVLKGDSLIQIRQPAISIIWGRVAEKPVYSVGTVSYSDEEEVKFYNKTNYTDQEAAIEAVVSEVAHKETIVARLSEALPPFHKELITGPKKLSEKFSLKHVTVSFCREPDNENILQVIIVRDNGYQKDERKFSERDEKPSKEVNEKFRKSLLDLHRELCPNGKTASARYLVQ